MRYARLFGNPQALNRYLRMQYLRPELRQVTGARVLDIGCLDGEFTRLLCGRGNRVHALDVRQHGFRAALPAVPFVLGRGDRLPYAAGSFDVVFCSDVLEHVPAGEAFLPEIARVLRPGGRCLLTTVDGRWQSPLRLRDRLRRLPAPWRDRLMGAFAMSDDDLHRAFMGHVRDDLAPALLAAACARCGLEPQRVRHYCRAWGALLMELFFCVDGLPRRLVFPLLRALLPLDRLITAGRAWQYALVCRKRADA